ncbi:unnamed protein product [Caenorhabditis angaria]|uniref:Uncharacterized protein n=1 Tax=Caenorhabditis angaria TaxID=860376 RepID=A0A9P1J5G6_9PELO|nr:unnamed protein product [Caenorhabditis angaria]
MARNSPINARQDLNVVHTFDTRESCSSRCRGTCNQQHSEDMMMPRWYCPQQEEENTDIEEEDRTTFGGKMLIIVPCVIFGSLFVLFFCVSAMQRLCRSDY